MPKKIYQKYQKLEDFSLRNGCLRKSEVETFDKFEPFRVSLKDVDEHLFLRPDLFVGIDFANDGIDRNVVVAQQVSDVGKDVLFSALERLNLRLIVDSDSVGSAAGCSGTV